MVKSQKQHTKFQSGTENCRSDAKNFKLKTENRKSDAETAGQNEKIVKPQKGNLPKLFFLL